MMEKKVLKSNLLFLFLVFLLSACDFTPRLHKEILYAQQLITEQSYLKAIAQYERILKKSPPKDIKIKVYYQIGELYSIYLLENIKAIEYYSKVIETSDDPLWMVKSEERIGDINFSFLKNYKDSAKNYKKLVEFVPKLKKSDFYQYRLALSYLNSRNLEEAKEILTEINNNIEHEYYVQSLYQIGMYYFLKKDWPNAIASWKVYIRKEKRRDSIIQTKFLMANAYETMEDLKTAYNIYYSILGKYPNTDVIKNRLEAIYSRRVARKR